MGNPRHNVFGNEVPPDERELGPRMAILDDLVRYIQEGKAEIISRHEVPPVNGRRMFKVMVALNDE